MVALLESIETASEAERREAFARLNYEFGRSQSKTRVYDDFEHEVFDAVCSVLASRMPIHNCANSMGVLAFKDSCAIAANFIRAASAVVLRKPDRETLLRLVMRSLRAHLELVGVPPSATAMLQNMNVLWFAVDKDYPGYAEARMLHFILNRVPV
jgi:hypothetical protein